MPTQLLSPGPPTTLVANQVYALPAVKTTLFADGATPTIAVSNTFAFTNSVPLVFTAGQAIVVGGFLKATTASVITLARD